MRKEKLKKLYKEQAEAKKQGHSKKRGRILEEMTKVLGTMELTICPVCKKAFEAGEFCTHCQRLVCCNCYELNSVKMIVCKNCRNK